MAKKRTDAAKDTAISVADGIERLSSIVIGIIVALLSLRFLLKLFGANQANDFVSWVYDTSAEVLAPFRGIFDTIRDGDFVIEFTTLFAIIAYMLLLLIIQAIVGALVARRP